jgi:hypothetical protein
MPQNIFRFPIPSGIGLLLLEGKLNNLVLGTFHTVAPEVFWRNDQNVPNLPRKKVPRNF